MALSQNIKKEKNMKKALSLILALAMLLALAACGTTAEKPAAEEPAASETTEAPVEVVEEIVDENALDTETPITLNIYGPGAFYTADDAVDPVTGVTSLGYNRIIDRFHELHPNVTVNIENIGWSDWQAAVAAAVAGGDIDLILHGGLVPQVCVNLSEYLEADPDFAAELYNIPEYNTSMINGVALNTPIVTSIPYVLCPGALVVDKSIFADYGLEVPTGDYTWDDILSLSEKMTGKDPVTGKQTYGFMLYGTNGNNVNKNFKMVAYSNDAQIINYGATVAECTVDFIQPAVIDSLAYLEKLAKTSSPDNLEGAVRAIQINEENDTAFGFTEVIASTIKQINTVGLEDRYAVIALPNASKGAGAGSATAYLGDNNIGICRHSQNKAWAWEFIKFLLTDEVCIEWMASNGNVGNTLAELEVMANYIGEDYSAMIKEILDELPAGVNGTTSAQYDSMNFSMPSIMSAQILELIRGNISVEECAEALQTEVSESILALS